MYNEYVEDMYYDLKNLMNEEIESELKPDDEPVGVEVYFVNEDDSRGPVLMHTKSVFNDNDIIVVNYFDPLRGNLKAPLRHFNLDVVYRIFNELSI